MGINKVCPSQKNHHPITRVNIYFFARVKNSHYLRFSKQTEF